MYATINPATGQTLRTFAPIDAGQLEAKLQCAAEAYQRHRRTAFAERSRLMLKAAEILEAEKESLGRLMVTEMGKPLKAAIEEAAKSAWGCRYYAEHAEGFLADEEVKTTASRSYIKWQPIGPVLDLYAEKRGRPSLTPGTYFRLLGTTPARGSIHSR